MIARPQALAADPVAAVLAEAVAAASAALYVVLADDDESALAELDFEAVVAVQLEHVVAAAQEAANVGRDIIMCGPVGPAVRSELVARVPTATLRFLDVQSPASALGYVGTVTCWSDADRARLRATWLKIAAEARIDRAPTADRGVPFEPKEPDAVPWPEPLSFAVRIGLAGDFLDLVEPQTEADPAAVLIDLLVRIGNAVGRGPHFVVSGDRHAGNLYALIVGATAQGRKGSSAAFPRRLLELADPTWAEACVLGGLSSGEGVIWRVRDATDTGRTDKDGSPIIEPGVQDKRLLCIETELARTLRATGRRDSTLGPVLRQAWDGHRLASMTKTPYRASDAHVSLVAHVTPGEFISLVRSDDIKGGTFNRCLFVASRRQRSLPFGGEVDEVAFAGIAARLQRCLSRARERSGAMGFSLLAQEVWPSLYERLQADEKAPGMVGELLGRATSQVRRLAMVFAIVDEQEHVDVRHLDAAAEVWRYSVATMRFVFGDGTGNRVADRILGELRGNPEQGIDRTAMHELFDRHVTAADIDAALALLHQLRLAEGRKTPTGGRPRETWFPTARTNR
jgi:hypothetical protein